MRINSILCHYFQKNLKRRRFWATPGTTHINRKWTFCTFEPWFWTNFEANRLFKSKTTLSNTNLVVPTGLLKREKGLLLDQPCSKTSLLILPIDFECEDCEWEQHLFEIFASTTEQPGHNTFINSLVSANVLMGSWFISLLQWAWPYIKSSHRFDQCVSMITIIHPLFSQL